MRRLPWTSPSMNDGGSSSARERCRVDSGCSLDAGARLAARRSAPVQGKNGTDPDTPTSMAPTADLTSGIDGRPEFPTSVVPVERCTHRGFEIFETHGRLRGINEHSILANHRNGIEGSVAARTMASATVWGSEGGPPPSRLAREFRNARARCSWAEPVQLAGWTMLS